MSSAGRPHALNEARCAEICDLVAAGHTVAAVARLIGCNVKTIRRHASRDEEFGRLLRAAELSSRADPLKMMRRAAGGSWRAAAWLLERTEPERYARQAPATCRPELVQQAFTRLIEAALQRLGDEASRRTVYQQLNQVAEEQTLRLFLPPSVRTTGPNPDHTPFVDQQRFHDYLEALTQPWQERAATPQKGDSVPGAATLHPKTQTPNSPPNPGENRSSRR